MRDQALQQVLEFAFQRFGSENVSSYGSSLNDPHGICFKITQIPATFSVHTQEGALSKDLIDVQVEGVPPGDFLVTGIVPFQRLESFILQLESLPESQWPTKFE